MKEGRRAADAVEAKREAAGILEFWIDRVGPEGWYRVDEAIDAEIRERWMPLWERARAGGLQIWLTRPETTLAYVILVDQFPRNMFRGDERAFATDSLARKAAKLAIDRGFDLRVPEPQRQFFYLPLMHSESATDQERAVRLFKTRMPETGAENLVHARAHREEIRRFGRFPGRNVALHRPTTEPERRYLEEEGGYGSVLERIRKRGSAGPDGG